MEHTRNLKDKVNSPLEGKPIKPSFSSTLLLKVLTDKRRSADPTDSNLLSRRINSPTGGTKEDPSITELYAEGS